MLANQFAAAEARASAPQAPSSQSPDLSGIRTIAQFAAQVIVRADLSRAACRVAIEKAERADVKEFAGYELMEAETVVSVLEDLGTRVPDMDAAARATLAKITGAPAGQEFDAAYMTAEYENHTFLRDLAAAYLKNSNARTADVKERHGRQLASIALFAFTEHAGITHRILRDLSASQEPAQGRRG